MTSDLVSRRTCEETAHVSFDQDVGSRILPPRRCFPLKSFEVPETLLHSWCQWHASASWFLNSNRSTYISRVKGLGNLVFITWVKGAVWGLVDKCRPCRENYVRRILSRFAVNPNNESSPTSVTEIFCLQKDVFLVTQGQMSSCWDSVVVEELLVTNRGDKQNCLGSRSSMN